MKNIRDEIIMKIKSGEYTLGECISDNLIRLIPKKNEEEVIEGRKKLAQIGERLAEIEEEAIDRGIKELRSELTKNGNYSDKDINERCEHKTWEYETGRDHPPETKEELKLIGLSDAIFSSINEFPVYKFSANIPKIIGKHQTREHLTQDVLLHIAESSKEITESKNPYTYH